MLREQAAADLILAGKLLYEHRLVVGIDGNLSARLDDGGYLTTPAGRCKGLLEANELVDVDAKGRARAGARPSSEFGMHLAVYAQRADVDAVLHAHPAFCTAFAAAGRPLERCVLPEMIVGVGSVPVSEYATPSTEEVAAVVRPLIVEHDAILLRNHGLLVCGQGVLPTLHKLENIEHWAQIEWLAGFLGGARSLTPQQVMRLREIRGVYGLTRPAPPCSHDDEAAATAADAELAHFVAQELLRRAN